MIVTESELQVVSSQTRSEVKKLVGKAKCLVKVAAREAQLPITARGAGAVMPRMITPVPVTMAAAATITAAVAAVMPKMAAAAGVAATPITAKAVVAAGVSQRTGTRMLGTAVGKVLGAVVEAGALITTIALLRHRGRHQPTIQA